MPPAQNDEGRLDICEDIEESVSNVLKIRNFLTLEEETLIHRQFCSSSWIPDYQVLWSGMLREQAQAWADEHAMQTLTTAMGPLMDPRAPSCPKSRKSDKAWSKYIHGASAVFAWHIANGDKVTVLSPPPPQRFHPSGLSYFQVVELPILTGAIAKGACLCIEIVHPAVKPAENYHYQLWPQDEASKWTAIFHTASPFKYNWRQVSGKIQGVSSEQALAQAKHERDRTISAVQQGSAAESNLLPERSNVFKKISKEDRSDNMVNRGLACSKRKFKKSKKLKNKRNKKAPSTPYMSAYKEIQKDTGESVTCKGPVSLIDDAIAAVELQHQLDFPKSQRAGLSPSTHPVTKSEKMESNQSLTDLQAKTLKTRKAPVKYTGSSTTREAVSSSDTDDQEYEKTSKSAKKKARMAQGVARERQMAPKQCATQLAKQARKAAKRAEAYLKSASPSRANSASMKKELRKAASKVEKQGFKKQRRELQKLVGITVLENLSCLISLNTY